MTNNQVNIVMPRPDESGKWIDHETGRIRIEFDDGIIGWSTIINPDKVPQDINKTAGVLFIDHRLTTADVSFDNPLGAVFVFEIYQDRTATVDAGRLSTRSTNLRGTTLTSDNMQGGGEEATILGNANNRVIINNDGIIMSTPGSTIGVDSGGDTVISSENMTMPDSPQIGAISKGEGFITSFIPKTVVTMPFIVRKPNINKLVSIVKNIYNLLSTIDANITIDSIPTTIMKLRR